MIIAAMILFTLLGVVVFAAVVNHGSKVAELEAKTLELEAKLSALSAVAEPVTYKQLMSLNPFAFEPCQAFKRATDKVVEAVKNDK